MSNQVFYYKIRNLEFEYDVSNISIQTLIGDFTHTLILSIPKIVYVVNTEFYNIFFSNIYFLKDGELLEDVIKKSLQG